MIIPWGWRILDILRPRHVRYATGSLHLNNSNNNLATVQFASRLPPPTKAAEEERGSHKALAYLRGIWQAVRFLLRWVVFLNRIWTFLGSDQEVNKRIRGRVYSHQGSQPRVRGLTL